MKLARRRGNGRRVKVAMAKPITEVSSELCGFVRGGVQQWKGDEVDWKGLADFEVWGGKSASALDLGAMT